MEKMNISEQGVMLIAMFEGLSLKPYYATAEEKKKGIATIGYGNTFYEDGTKVKITDNPITKMKAFCMLENVAQAFAQKLNINSNVNQNQFDALVSIAYNIGVNAFNKSTLLKMVNENPNNPAIKEQFLRWNKQSGTVLKGLTKRRERESEYYFK